MTTTSSENPIDTETFLLPGQQFCIGLPWERGNLPQHGLPPPAPKPLVTGNTLDAEADLAPDPCAGWEVGSCQIIRRLSPGSAKILLALREDERDGSTLAVLRKIGLPDVLADDIQAQAARAMRLRHPNLARIFPVEVCDEGIFFVAEFTSGATLAEISAACRRLGKAVPLGVVLGAIHEAALGLAEIHAQPDFAHGLISDQSVAVCFDGTAKLLDAGLFRCIGRQGSWAEVLEPMGPYLAPEQVLRGYPPDPKSDVFSLATVLYECLAGDSQRQGSFDDRVKAHAKGKRVPPSSLNRALGTELDEVVFTALESDRAKRYPSALEFARALHRASSAFIWKSGRRADFVGELFRARRRREQVLLGEADPENLKRTVAKRKPTSPFLQLQTQPPPLPTSRPAVNPVHAAAAPAMAARLAHGAPAMAARMALAAGIATAPPPLPASVAPREEELIFDADELPGVDPLPPSVLAARIALSSPIVTPIIQRAVRVKRKQKPARRTHTRALALTLVATALGWVAVSDLPLDVLMGEAAAQLAGPAPTPARVVPRAAKSPAPEATTAPVPLGTAAAESAPPAAASAPIAAESPALLSPAIGASPAQLPLIEPPLGWPSELLSLAAAALPAAPEPVLPSTSEGLAAVSGATAGLAATVIAQQTVSVSVRAVPSPNRQRRRPVH